MSVAAKKSINQHNNIPFFFFLFRFLSSLFPHLKIYKQKKLKFDLIFPYFKTTWNDKKLFFSLYNQQQQSTLTLKHETFIISELKRKKKLSICSVFTLTQKKFIKQNRPVNSFSFFNFLFFRWNN